MKTLWDAWLQRFDALAGRERRLIGVALLGGIVLLKNDQRMLIPYYAWDNREPGAMTVWMREYPVCLLTD